jgi:predicted dehydrogenase
MHVVCSRGFARLDSPWTYLEYGPDGEHLARVTADEVEGPSGYELELESFARWILHGEAPVLTAAEGRAAVAVAEAIETAERTGEPALVPVG